MIVRARVVVLLMVVAFVGAACSSSDSGSDAEVAEPTDAPADTEAPDETDETDTPQPTGAAADDDGEYVLPEPSTRGLTDDEIRIGVMILDLSVDVEVGADLSASEGTRGYEVFFDDLNSRGGINGRTVVPSYYSFSPLDPIDQQAKCIAATQDEKVFMVIVTVGFDGESKLCLTEQNETLVYSGDSAPESYLERSNGLLFSATMNDTRVARAWVDVLDEVGELEGKTIGIIREDTLPIADAFDNGVKATLIDLGYEVAAEVVLPCEGLFSPCSQHENGVEVLRDAGVDTVFSGLTGTSNPAFVSTALAAGYEPQYYVNGLNATATLTGIMTADETRARAYDGTLSVNAGRRLRTSADQPNIPGPSDQAFECEARYNEITGEGIAYDVAGIDNDTWGLITGSCGFVLFIERVLSPVPADELTTATASKAVQDYRVSVTTPAGAPPDGFAPGKFDALNSVTLQRFDFECLCWLGVDGKYYEID